MGYIIDSDPQKSQNYARNVKRASTVIYVGGVLFAEVMFLWFLESAFDSLIVGLFAAFGAVMVGISGIVFLYAKEHWFADGLHEKLGYTFWAIDIAMLALNTLVAFEVAGKLDTASAPIVGEVLNVWRSVSPATPLIVISMWAILRATSPEMELQKSHNKSMARLIKYHAEQLEKEAMNSPEAKRIIASAAQELTVKNARLLTGENITAGGKKMQGIPMAQVIEMNSDGVPLSELVTDEEVRENGRRPKSRG